MAADGKPDERGTTHVRGAECATIAAATKPTTTPRTNSQR
jgi:hypothetical protein